MVGDFNLMQAELGSARGARRETNLLGLRGSGLAAGPDGTSRGMASADFESDLRESHLRQLASSTPRRSSVVELAAEEDTGTVAERTRSEDVRRRDRTEAPRGTRQADQREADRPQPVKDPEESGDRADAAAAAWQPLVQVSGEVAAKAESGGDVETPIENPWVTRLVERGAERGPTVRTDTTEGERLTPEAPRQVEQLAPQMGADSGDNSFDLLEFQELMDPDLEIDTAADEMIERLQQALANGAAVSAEEMGEVVLPQVVRGLASLVKGNGVSEMRMQLKPADLGEIELRVRAVEGLIRGEIIVQSPELKNLLESQLDRLRHALSQHGLELEGFDVGVASQGRGNEADESGGDGLFGSNAWRTAGRDSESRAAETAAIPARSPSGDSEVDYIV